MRLSKIDQNLTIYKENSVVIWGTGSAGKRIYRLLRVNEININYFCDSDCDKWGKEYCGVKVISPKELEQWYADSSCVVQIASSWEKEIEEELLKRGIENYILYSEANVRLLNLKKYKVSLENPEIFHHYLDQWYYPWYSNEILWGWDTLMAPFVDYQDEVIILCMPPKTGDWTVMNTLDQLDVCYINLWHAPFRFTKEVKKFIGDRKIKVITATRDIISQNLSLLFQTMDQCYFDCEEYWKDGGDLTALFSKYVKDFSEWEAGTRTSEDGFWAYKKNFPYISSMQTFLQKEFRDFFGINLYETVFDKERGYSIVKQGNIEVFIYQIEQLNAIYPDLFHFLNISGQELIMGNTAIEKWYFPYYKKAFSKVEISREYFEMCYGSEYLHHFYNDGDIKKFREKWMPNIKN